MEKSTAAFYSSNAQNRNRTSDTRIFSPLLYQLSYLGILRNPLIPTRCTVPATLIILLYPDENVKCFLKFFIFFKSFIFYQILTSIISSPAGNIHPPSRRYRTITCMAARARAPHGYLLFHPLTRSAAPARCSYTFSLSPAQPAH